MKLYLAQHALAKISEEDPRRPVSEIGMADLLKMTYCVNSHIDFSVNAIYHSGKLRARQTAECFAEYIHPPGGIKESDGLDPNENPQIWATRLKQIKENILLVGHLPHLSRLASLLLINDPDKEVLRFYNAGIVCLQSDYGKGWSLEWTVNPDILR